MSKRNTIVTPEARIMFPSLFEPSAFESGRETYSCLLVFESGADISELENAVKGAFNEKFPNGAGNARHPINNGDDKVADWGEAFAGTRYVRVSTLFKPAVVDRNRQPIADPAAVYSGCYVRAAVSPYAYDARGNKGVALGLEAIQFVRDGEATGGGGAASVGLFSDLGEGDKAKMNNPFA